MSEIINLLSNRVLLKEVKPKETTQSGIIIPETMDQGSPKWEIISVGKEVSEVKVGDIIALGQFSGEPIKLQDIDYRLVNEDEIIGVF